MTATLMERISNTQKSLKDALNEIYKYVNNFLRENNIYNISSKDMLFLYDIFVLYGENSCIISTELNTFYKSRNISYNIKKLIEHDYIEKKLNEGDIRTYFISFTEKTKDLIRNFNNSLTQMVEVDNFKYDNYIQEFDLSLAKFRCRFREMTSTPLVDWNGVPLNEKQFQ